MRYCSLYLICCLAWAGCSVNKKVSDSLPVSHQIWDSLLYQHVSTEGWVDYSGFRKDSAHLNRYLQILGRHHPNQKNWSDADQIAYWINAYNAFTVYLVLQHYPVESIKDIRKGIPFINSVWDLKFIEIEGHLYDLNDIEHGILRKHYDEPRIHFAINCASVSCPKLLNQAYVPALLNDQLDQAAKSFLNDPLRNRITPQKAELSKIFSWFKGDFVKRGAPLTEYINQFLTEPVPPGVRIEFMEYDWSLNDPPSE